jgi:hypothetical protein
MMSRMMKIFRWWMLRKIGGNERGGWIFWFTSGAAAGVAVKYEGLAFLSIIVGIEKLPEAG